MSFSERLGFKPVRTAVQKDSMDKDLRNGLWNVFDSHLRSQLSASGSHNIADQGVFADLARRIWRDHFKLPVDEMKTSYEAIVGEIRTHFLYDEPWYRVYDLIEFVVNAIPSYPRGESVSYFIEAYNDMLRREVSAYRFVDKRLVPITSEPELVAIEEAIAATAASSPLNLVNTHLNQALASLADRTAPDYRNSMKESISAVECICKLIAKTPNATLSPALNAIQASGKVQLHQDLVDGFKKIYHYTSDSSGIRHALKDAPTVDVEDARYMLVACAAFVSFAIEKATKAGITL